MAADREPGREWLNGPLVWAIDEWHSPMYLFPRDCPRILLWPTDATTETDRKHWFGHTAARMLAYVEDAWEIQLRSTELYRYLLPPPTFVYLGEIGHWVSREGVVPTRVDVVDDLTVRLEAAGVELRLIPSLLPLRGVWDTTLHASGIRLRNALGWEK